MSDIERPSKAKQASFGENGDLVVKETNPQETTFGEWGVDVPDHDPDTRLDKGEGSLTADTTQTHGGGSDGRQEPLFHGCADPSQETLGTGADLEANFGGQADSGDSPRSHVPAGIRLVLNEWLPAPARLDREQDSLPA